MKRVVKSTGKPFNFIYLAVSAHAMAHVWRSEDSPGVSSPLLPFVSAGQNSVKRLSGLFLPTGLAHHF